MNIYIRKNLVSMAKIYLLGIYLFVICVSVGVAIGVGYLQGIILFLFFFLPAPSILKSFSLPLVEVGDDFVRFRRFLKYYSFSTSQIDLFDVDEEKVLFFLSGGG